MLIRLLVCLAFIFSCSSSARADESVYSQGRLARLLRTKIAVAKDIAANPKVIAAVKARNGQGLSLAEIKRRDQLWQRSHEKSPFKKKCLQSEINHFFFHLVNFHSEIYSEIFLTDAQGANIACYPLTSDYWQGDEQKWIQAYNKGAGKVHFGQIEFDQSSQCEAIQVSLPVMDGDQAIGVLIVGVKLTHIQALYLKGE